MSDQAARAALQLGADVVVGTPGKLEHFLKMGELDLSFVHFFILDEADRLFL